jgi:hypothetical protein
VPVHLVDAGHPHRPGRDPRVGEIADVRGQPLRADVALHQVGAAGEILEDLDRPEHRRQPVEINVTVAGHPHRDDVPGLRRHEEVLEGRRGRDAEELRQRVDRRGPRGAEDLQWWPPDRRVHSGRASSRYLVWIR